jgi:AraC family transcriptional regulator
VRPERLSSGHHGRISEIRTIVDFKFFETRYESGSALPLHSHDHACICVVVSGTFHELFPRHTLQLIPKSIAFRPAGEVHSDRFGSTGAHCLVIELPGGWMDHGTRRAQFFDGPICVQRGQLPWLGARLYKEFKQSDEVAPLVIEGIMLEIAGEFLRYQQDMECKVPRWLESAREAVHAHYTRTFRLRELAACAGVHPVHLAREFQRHYGCSVGNYVRNLRIDAACERLAHSDASIAEIALDTGFSNQAHFSRTFRLATGVPPGRYRLQRR